MKIATVGEVKSQLSEFVKSSAEGPVVVTRRGKPVAVLVGVEDELKRLLMACSPRLREVLKASREEISAGKGIEHQDFWAAFDSEGGPNVQ